VKEIIYTIIGIIAGFGAIALLGYISLKMVERNKNDKDV